MRAAASKPVRKGNHLSAAIATKSCSSFISDGDNFFNEDGVKLEVIELAIPYNAQDWLKYAKKVKDGRNVSWCCTWKTRKNGESATCTYLSKKWLTKRHVEAAHLLVLSHWTTLSFPY